MTVVHLGGDDGLIEAAARVRAAPEDDELVLAVPEDAPVLANPLFLRTLRDLRPSSRFVLVTADARGRAFASGAHLPAYASLAAYEQKTLDPTERLERARLAALAEIGRERTLRRRQRGWRAGGVAVSTLVLLLAIGPSAHVVVAADATGMAPIELQVVAGPNAPIRASRLRTVLNSTVKWSTGGARIDRIAAKGMEKITNGSTDAIDIPAGFAVSTSGGILFRTLEARHLDPSRFFPLVYTSTQVPIEAVEKGPSGNVARNTITRVGNGDRRLYVTNDQPTAGGEEKRVPVVAMSDYTAAAAALDKDIATKVDEQLRAWAAGVPAGSRLEPTHGSQTVARTTAGEVLQKEVESFSLNATIEISAYAVPEEEPRATALRRLNQALRSEHELVPSTVDIQTTGTTVADDGVTWRVTARASERPRVDGGSVQSALAGQDRAAAARVLEGRGIVLRELTMFPSWWPRLPFVPLRIDVRSAEEAASTP